MPDRILSGLTIIVIIMVVSLISSYLALTAWEIIENFIPEFAALANFKRGIGA
jgi:hypothetical protein